MKTKVFNTVKVNIVNKVNTSELINEYIINGGTVTKCKNAGAPSTNRPKPIKNGWK